jgi:deaminated glutathione amidase
MAKILVATCQFPVTADIESNLQFILEHMESGKSQNADVCHFPEASLSGYAGVDFTSFESFNWDALRRASREIIRLAGELKIWTIFGSAHELTGSNKPHNSSYIINAEGKLVDRYDKLFCAGNIEQSTDDLAHYSSGSHFSTFEINGVRCGVLICHDYRYPELYREYKRRGVQLIFHSFHVANVSQDKFEQLLDYVGRKHRYLGSGGTLPAVTMPAGMIASASNNFVWISCPNSSTKESCWPSFFVRPDGVIIGALETGECGILVSEVDTEAKLYDSTVAWRDRAMNGIYHSGVLVEDARSCFRTEL